LLGNDDYGTMSSWFMFGALGFYPLSGSDIYMIGSPLFENVTIHRPNGDLRIITHNNGTSERKKNHYMSL
jgi:putative alpha-1,2-mannosidase